MKRITLTIDDDVFTDLDHEVAAQGLAYGFYNLPLKAIGKIVHAIREGKSEYHMQYRAKGERR